MDLNDVVGQAVYETYDTVHALKENPATQGKTYDKLNLQERLMVSSPYSPITNLIVQLFEIVDDISMSIIGLVQRIDRLEKKERK